MNWILNITSSTPVDRDPKKEATTDIASFIMKINDYAFILIIRYLFTYHMVLIQHVLERHVTSQ